MKVTSEFLVHKDYLHILTLMSGDAFYIFFFVMLQGYTFDDLFLKVSWGRKFFVLNRTRESIKLENVGLEREYL